MLNKKKVIEKIKYLYKDYNAEDIYIQIVNAMKSFEEIKSKARSKSPTIMITYATSIKDGNKPALESMEQFLDNYVGDSVEGVHFLPFYPFTSDDGFSVVDYTKVDGKAGTWDNLTKISKNYSLMYDAVINHISKSSDWFKGYLEGKQPYNKFFIECDPDADYSMVTRPRALPLLTKFDTVNGEKYIWTTFSDDQIDLNYNEPLLFIEILKVLLLYVNKGCQYIRLDAIGFMFKQLGTKCMHLPQTHVAISLMKDIITEYSSSVWLVTETNVPHKDNISYFGNGKDEADMVYQFTLPPLVLYTFLNENSKLLTDWAKDLTPAPTNSAYFNFLASHDGIGVVPIQSLVSESEFSDMLEKVKAKGGRISYKNNPDGRQSPYELNINYLSAVTEKGDSNDVKAEKFMASQAIILSMQGVPAIYIHSLLGSQNWEEGVISSGINRRINREALNYNDIKNELSDEKTLRYKVFTKYKKLLDLRKTISAFELNAKQTILDISQELFVIERENENTGEKVTAIINVTSKPIKNEFIYGIDIISEKEITKGYEVKPYEVLWVK